MRGGLEPCAPAPLQRSPPRDSPLRGTPWEVEESDPDRPPCQAGGTDLPAGNIPSLASLRGRERHSPDRALPAALCPSLAQRLRVAEGVRARTVPRARAITVPARVQSLPRARAIPIPARVQPLPRPAAGPVSCGGSAGDETGSERNMPEISASNAVGSCAGAVPSTGQGDTHSCAGAAASTAGGGLVSCGGSTGDSSGSRTTMRPPHFRQRIRAPFSPLSSATSRRKWAPQSPHVMSINDNACTSTASSPSGLQFAGSPSRRKYRRW